MFSNLWLGGVWSFCNSHTRSFLVNGLETKCLRFFEESDDEICNKKKKKTDIIPFYNVPWKRNRALPHVNYLRKCPRQLHISAEVIHSPREAGNHDSYLGATLLSTLSIYSLIMSLTSFTATYFLYLAFKVRLSCSLSIIHFHFS